MYHCLMQCFVLLSEFDMGLGGTGPVLVCAVVFFSAANNSNSQCLPLPSTLTITLNINCPVVSFTHPGQESVSIKVLKPGEWCAKVAYCKFILKRVILIVKLKV